jgi:hypothetical protein
MSGEMVDTLAGTPFTLLTNLPLLLLLLLICSLFWQIISGEVVDTLAGSHSSYVTYNSASAVFFFHCLQWHVWRDG